MALGALADGKNGEAMAEVLTGFANTSSRVPKMLRNLLAEVIGTTDSNWGVLRMVNQVRYQVSALRQDYREELPKLFAEKFSRKLSDVEWSRLHLGLGRTDVASLLQSFSINDVGRILSNAARLDAEIAKTEAALKAQFGKNFASEEMHMDALAKFMVTGQHESDNEIFLRNATAIARGVGFDMPTKLPDAEHVKLVDTLVSLKAIKLLDSSTADTLSSLVQNEADGMKFLTLYLGDVRQRELKKAEGTRAKLNGYKGFIPSENETGASLIVRDDSEHDELIRRGYERVGDYAGMEHGRMGYYYSSVAGRSSYQQGILQTVHQSSFGVNAQTGFTTGGHSAGVITGRAFINLKRDMDNGQLRRNSTEILMPVFDEDGYVVAFERSIRPEQQARLNGNTHIGEMLGAWSGRQAEEELALEFNKILVERLKDMWEEAKRTGRTNEFVDVLDKDHKDKVLRDTQNLIPTEVRHEAVEVFGLNTLPVRKDLLDNVLGYRLPSVADFWTGNSNVPAPAQEAFRMAATAIFRNSAFKYLVTSERAWQTLISQSKNIIVVSSVIVPLSNLASNFIQLMMLGVNPRDIKDGVITKLMEIEKHQRNLKARVDLQAELARYRTNPDKVRALTARIKLLDDADRRMSIWPLIEAGEFTTISEGLTQVDASLSHGKISDWIKAQYERAPAKLGTLGRYAMLTRDTALFQGMSRATQYGDFLAKAVLYDHMTQKKGKSHEEVLRAVNEEFVNYNFLPGRGRSYAESIGLTWFWAFKLRSMKVALNHARNNPFRSLVMSAGLPVAPDLPVIDIGTPIQDNMLSAAADGRFWNSIGLDQFFRAHTLNPWYNLAF